MLTCVSLVPQKCWTSQDTLAVFFMTPIEPHIPHGLALDLSLVLSGPKPFYRLPADPPSPLPWTLTFTPPFYRLCMYG